MSNPTAVDLVRAYHERTKHHLFRYARALGYLDWATQPDPFRRYQGAPLLPLDLIPLTESPRYEPAFVEAPGAATAALDRRSISQLFQDALALSAWKEAGPTRWALRINPSSGNLHPTEGYLVAGPVPGLTTAAGVFHYAPLEHALEQRTTLPAPLAQRLFAQLPPGAVLIGLSSIAWREAWKYGERAFRYCQHDAGHAIAAVAVAAAGLGWQARLLESVTSDDLAALLGIARPQPPEDQTEAAGETEDPDCLIAVYPSTSGYSVPQQRAFTLAGLLPELDALPFTGVANVLSSDHHPWPELDEVAAATRQQVAPAADFWNTEAIAHPALAIGDSALSLRSIVHGRRSAVALDGRTGITRDTFYQILLKAMPGPGQVPFATLPWRPRINLLLFVHRVQDLTPGLYALCRDPRRQHELRAALGPPLEWTVPPGCPPGLPLVRLQAGDARPVAEQTSCGQSIAKDGVFAVAMLADYRDPLQELGAWFYRRLHWEAGAIGQLLYLEAEASGIRGTGIGCFFDDVTLGAFGLSTDARQVLYHFTMGGPVEDRRLRTLAPYAHLQR